MENTSYNKQLTLTITWTIEIEIDTHFKIITRDPACIKIMQQITCVKSKYSTKTLEMERTQKEHAKGKIWFGRGRNPEVMLLGIHNKLKVLPENIATQWPNDRATGPT